MCTRGGRSVTIVMLTGPDVAVAPPLSVATAVRTCTPTGALLHVTRNGSLTGNTPQRLVTNITGAVAVPRLLEPAKNCTLATVPSGSNAAASTSTFVGPRISSPFSGSVMCTRGGKLVTTE